ncbi:helix-turn-helix domain-containing protein [Ureibacillus sinduriensis]|nr:transcriptional regulator [Ureibacillus sinduriensis]
MERRHKIGKTIKFFRQLNNMNQDTLAVGICTTSYLSRIENGLVEPNETVYRMLFERLHLDFTAYVNEEKNKERLIEQIYEKLLSNEKVDKEEIEELRLLYEQRTSPSIQVQVDLVYCRYLMSIDSLDEAAGILSSLDDLLSPSASREWQLFVAVKTYYELMIGSFDTILNREFQTNSKFYLSKSSSFEQANYMYHLAFASHRAYHFSLAKQFIKEAIRLFKHQYKPLFQLKLYSMYGAILNGLGEVKAAFKEFYAAIDLLHHVPSIATDVQWSSIYNNLAFAYESDKQYMEAIKFYEKALAFKKDKHTLINYTRTLLFGGVQELFSEKLHDLSINDFDEGTHQQMQFILMQAIEQIDGLEGLEEFYKIEKKVFKFFIVEQHIELILSYGPLVAKIYEEAKQYKRAAELYRLLFETSETMRLRAAGSNHL